MKFLAITVVRSGVAAPALAAEGAESRYLPGAGDDTPLAVPPEPGLTVANTGWWQSGEVGRAVLGGVVANGGDA